MPKLFQIYEADLAELERILPALSDTLYSQMNNVTRVRLRTVQRILSSVRWNYGPPSQVEKIEPNEPE